MLILPDGMSVGEAEDAIRAEVRRKTATASSRPYPPRTRRLTADERAEVRAALSLRSASLRAWVASHGSDDLAVRADVADGLLAAVDAMRVEVD